MRTGALWGMENMEWFWVKSQKNWILCIHLLNFQLIHPPGRILTQQSSLAKFLGIPFSRQPDISAPPQLLSRRSSRRSMSFQHCGTPQCPFEQLEDRLLLCTICSGSSYHVFSRSQCLLCRVREMNSRSSCRNASTEGRNSVPSLKSPVFTS